MNKKNKIIDLVLDVIKLIGEIIKDPTEEKTNE